MKLQRAFFAHDAEWVARGLIGATLHREFGGTTWRARVVETEAYVGEHDLACHASRGRTPRTDVMFGEAGHAYVYLIYGMHHMLNIVTGEFGQAQAVLLRAAEPLDEWAINLTGPGRLARGFNITRMDNGLNAVSGPLFFEKAPVGTHVGSAPRVGIDYAGKWVDAPLRFFDLNSPWVSKPWPTGLSAISGRPSIT